MTVTFKFRGKEYQLLARDVKTGATYDLKHFIDTAFLEVIAEALKVLEDLKMEIQFSTEREARQNG